MGEVEDEGNALAPCNGKFKMKFWYKLLYHIINAIPKLIWKNKCLKEIYEGNKLYELISKKGDDVYGT